MGLEKVPGKRPLPLAAARSDAFSPRGTSTFSRDLFDGGGRNDAIALTVSPPLHPATVKRFETVGPYR